MRALLFLLLFPCMAHAGPYYELVNDTTVGTATMSLSGYFAVAASSKTPTAYKFRIDGPGGYIQFPDGSKATSACTSGTCEKGDTGAAGAQGIQGIQGVPGDPAGNTFISSITIVGQTLLKNRVDISSNVYITGLSSATAYYGDGSHLTGNVSQLIAGTGISLSPTTGLGAVTVTATSGGGDVYKASTQTFTGQNTFTNSVTVSSFTSPSAITIGNATANNHAVALGQFASSLGTNGYQKLPNGVILQWGKSGAIAANSTVSVTFSIAFPTACMVVLADAFGPAQATQPVSVVSFTTSGAVLYGTGFAGSIIGSAANYIAIGY